MLHVQEHCQELSQGVEDPHLQYRVQREVRQDRVEGGEQRDIQPLRLADRAVSAQGQDHLQRDREGVKGSDEESDIEAAKDSLSRAVDACQGGRQGNGSAVPSNIRGVIPRAQTVAEEGVRVLREGDDLSA